MTRYLLAFLLFAFPAVAQIGGNGGGINGNAYLPLTGGTITGALTAASLATSNAGALNIPNGAAFSGDLESQFVVNPLVYGSLPIIPPGCASCNAPSVVTSFINSNENGGTSGSVYTGQNNVVFINGNPNFYWWVGLDQLASAGGGTGQHVARYAQTVRSVSDASGPSNNPSLWAMVAESDDFTGLKSSQTNNQLSTELDLKGSNLDDKNYRVMLSGVIAPVGSSFYEAATGYSLTVNSGAYLKKMLLMGGNFTNSMVDLRYASGYYRYATSLSPVTFPTVTSTVSSSKTIPVSNVMPFTSDIYGRDINTTPSTVQVVFSDTGNVATVTGYTVTGTGTTPAGTLTVSNNVSVASGASVYNQSKGIWLPTYMPIALDTGGATTLFSDGTYIHSAPLSIGTSSPANGYYSPVTASVTIGDVGNTAPYGTHIAITQTTAPTITNGALDATGSDVAGTVTLSAANPVVTFKVAYATAPHCVISSPTGTAFTYTTSTTALTVTGGANTNKFTYHCLQ